VSSDVALIGRLEGDEDVVEVDRQSVARFNATVMGYALKQIYAADDQCYYARPGAKSLDKLSTVLEDPNLKVRDDSPDLSNVADRLSKLTVSELKNLAKMLQDKWKISGEIDTKA
jgi:hypothetical protein